MSFAPLGLATPLLKAVADQGYETPSPIQAQAIPAVLQGRDVMAAAQTGTGKTAGFTLPLLHRLSEGERAGSNRARALILTPTRELAAQIGENVTAYSKYLPMRSAVVFGGVSINPQMKALRQGVDVLVATPGRLLDLHNQNAVRFNDLEVLVLDEADRMLDMGFINDIKKILKLLPAKRQNLLFSATFSDDIRALAKGLVNNPVEIDVSPRNSTVTTISQTVYTVDKKRKPALLTQLIQDGNWRQALVFTKTKHGANRLSEHLEKAGIRSAAIHGNKSQNARTKALEGFKAGKIHILVATDIAARGIDIDQLPQVVNFDLPNVPEDYVHRIGRTGRAGASGKAYSLVSADEAKLLAAIERLTKQTITRTTLDGYEPDQNVPFAKADDARPARRPNSNGGGRSRNGASAPSRDGQARDGRRSSGNGSGGRGRSGGRSSEGGRSSGNRPSSAGRSSGNRSSGQRSSGNRG